AGAAGPVARWAAPRASAVAARAQADVVRSPTVALRRLALRPASGAAATIRLLQPISAPPGPVAPASTRANAGRGPDVTVRPSRSAHEPRGVCEWLKSKEVDREYVN